MISKVIQISARIIKSYPVNRSILFWVWRKIIGNWDNSISEFPKGVKATAEQMLGPEERHKPKRTGLRQSQLINQGHLSIWVRWLQIKIYNIWSINCTETSYSLQWKPKNISQRVDWKYLTYVRWNNSKIWTQALRLIVEKM